MAQLGSPGVQVNVIDESFYNPATPGTIPLIVIATAEDKTNASGTGIASGTSASNANSLYLATSQKDLTDRFGVPKFQKDASGNAIQGSELNEYGLFAAYSYLGASNSAYILRSSVDLDALVGSANVPTGDPVSDTYWLDTSKTRIGAFEWNASLQQFVSKTPLQLFATDVTSSTPKASVGTIGDYAVVLSDPTNTVWYKNTDARWVKVGSKGATVFGSNTAPALDWKSSWPVVSTSGFTGLSVSSVTHSPVASTAARGGNPAGGVTNATFSVHRFGGSYAVIDVVTAGAGYQAGDIITLLGTDLGGLSTLNDVTITVTSGMLSGGALLVAEVPHIQVSGTAATVSDLGMKITIHKADNSTSIINFKVDGLGAPGSSTATIDEIATELNAVLNTHGVGARIVDSKIQFITKDDHYLVFAAPDTGTSVLGTGANQLGIVAGTYRAPTAQFSDHTKLPFWSATDATPRPTGSVWFKTTEFNLGAKWTVKRFNSDTRVFEVKDAPVYAGTEEAIYKLDPLLGGSGIAVGKLFVNANFEENTDCNFKLMYRVGSGSTVASTAFAGSISSTTATLAETVKGSSASVTATITTGTSIETLVAAINNSALSNVVAAYSSGRLTLTHTLGGEIYLDGAVWSTLGFGTATNTYAGPSGSVYEFRISNWKPLSSIGDGYFAQSGTPTDNPADGSIWYSTSQTQVDIMIHDGTTWVGLQNDGVNSSSGAQVLVQASKPTVSGRAVGDIWVDTSSQDNYGRVIKRWNPNTLGWDAIDVTDHTSQYGIIFADARWGLSGATGDTLDSDISMYWSNDYLDPDAPDPAAYPRGMLLWNTRRSGFNIKQYKRDYINKTEKNTRVDISIGGEPMTGYTETNRWVSISGQDLNQVAYFGRKAQRSYVVGQLKVAINTNQRILDEDNIYFNLIACPGYPELISDMVNLNNSRNGTALVVGDTPLRLDSTASSLINYGTDYYNTGIDGEAGLHTQSDHLAVYYPAGLTTDLSGSNVVVPASHMMMRTIAVSDQRSFQWFAPAGTRRGGITNATSVGYLKDGSFIPVSLNQGTRDQMAQVKINPITNIPGAGLVAFGQYTKTGTNSSLDRINVARLVSYLRRQLGIITKPFLFEPNDKQTRSEIKNVCESLMLDLVSLRGIYDFIVVCDETNNTSSVISNNQLYVDIAVEPVKAVEFIYIPLRLKNVGDIKSRQ